MQVTSLFLEDIDREEVIVEFLQVPALPAQGLQFLIVFLEEHEEAFGPVLDRLVLAEVEEVGLLQALRSDCSPELALVVAQGHLSLLAAAVLFYVLFEIAQGSGQVVLCLGLDPECIPFFCYLS